METGQTRTFMVFLQKIGSNPPRQFVELSFESFTEISMKTSKRWSKIQCLEAFGNFPQENTPARLDAPGGPGYQ